MRFLPSLLTKTAAPTEETKSWDGGASWGGMLARLRDPRRPWPVERAVAEGMERVVWVFKPVNAIAGHASDLRLRRVRNLPGGEKEVLEDDALTYLLNQGQANALEKGPQLQKRLSAQVSLSPRGAFVELTTSRRGEVVGADLLPPGRTRPVPGRSGKLLSHYETITPDGQLVAIPPEKVRWFRDPHPLHPYLAITPMEAAGLSVDLDFLARLYNATFLRNDGRPGGVIGIDGEVGESELRRIEDSFGKGAHESGKITVLEGDLSYVDLASRPRDMAYKELASITKDEILTAFGTPESVLGNASGRTFANAEQELENFWTITMPPHLKILSSGWDYDPVDDVVYEFDTDGVEALQRPKVARRAEAREEFERGLISPNEYRLIAGYEEVDTPQMRAVFIGQSKTPIPTRQEDAVALGLAPPIDEQPPADGQEAAPEEADGQTDDTGDLAADEGAQGAMARLQALLDEDAASSFPPDEEEDAPAAEDQEAEEVKPQRAAAREKKHDHAGQRLSAVRQELEDDLAAVLTQLGTRLVERTAARLESPKSRKNTRHFVAEYKVDTRVGSDLLNVERIVPGPAWQAEAEQVVAPVVQKAAATVVGLTTSGEGLNAEAVIDRSLPEVSQTVAEVTEWAGGEFAGLVGRVRSLVAGLDGQEAEMAAIVEAVRGIDTKAWAVAAAVRSATAAVNGTAAVVAEHAVPRAVVVRRWQAGDGEPHHGVQGQIQPGGEPFTVGETRLRWPGDVRGSAEETAGCRCWLTHIILPE